MVHLAHRYGVATHYVDWTGGNRVVPESTLLAVLDALGVPADTEEDRAAAFLAHDRAYWENVLPPTVVVRADRPAPFWVHVTHGDPVDVWIRLEDGTAHGGLRQLDNDRPPYDLDGRFVRVRGL